MDMYVIVWQTKDGKNKGEFSIQAQNYLAALRFCERINVNHSSAIHWPYQSNVNVLPVGDHMTDLEVCKAQLALARARNVEELEDILFNLRSVNHDQSNR